MKWIILLCVSFLFVSCASKEVEVHSSGLIVKEINPNKFTAMTKQNILNLAQVYELSPFLYSKDVHVQSQVTPHSHPVITLSTRHAEQPKKILSTLLHEELHWWLETNKLQTETAIKELAKMYPKAPIAGKSTRRETYVHLMVCYLELKALSFYLGDKEAKNIITSLMRKDKIYPWAYYQVLYKDYAIRQVIRRNKLLPPILALEPNKKSAALLRK